MAGTACVGPMPFAMKFLEGILTIARSNASCGASAVGVAAFGGMRCRSAAVAAPTWLLTCFDKGCVFLERGARAAAPIGR